MCNFGSLNFWIGRSDVFKLFINWLSLGSLLVAQEKSPGSSTKGGAVIFKEEISVKWIPWRCLECLDIRTQSSHHPRGFLRAKDHPIAFQPRVGREMDYVPKWQPSASSPVLISLFEKKKNLWTRRCVQVPGSAAYSQICLSSLSSLVCKTT